MLLTQKPQPINLGRHHRRHPASLSHITALPHPVPGLLSLSKPTKPQRLPSRLPPRPQSPRFPPRSRIHRPKTADLPSVPPNIDQVRGRSHAPVQRRSPSQVRLPDTPVDPVVLPFPNVPQQAQDSPSEPPTIAPQPSGRLARSRRTRHKSTPTAALDASLERPPSPAKRPQPSAPIAVPNSRRTASPAHKILSRSDPLSKLTIHTDLAPPPKGSTRREKRRRNRTKAAPDGGALPLAEWDFPAPGTSDDDVEGEDTDDREPTTPIGQTGSNDKAWNRALFDGPKTAPLHSSTASPTRGPGQFPFFQFPLRTKTPAPTVASPPTTPPSSRKRPDHRRAPSHPPSLGRASSAPEPMFHLSEDEVEAEALPVGADVREKMALLFGNGGGTPGTVPLFATNGSPSPSPRKAHRLAAQRESVDGVARQLFASSSFQIAPEPVELPKPSFLLA